VLSVPEADVENLLAAVKRQLAELLLRHRLLKARLAIIVARMPLRHEMPSGARGRLNADRLGRTPPTWPRRTPKFSPRGG
jgi:hypothetical protein